MTMIKVNSNDYMRRYKCEKIKQTNKLTLISIFEKSKEYSKMQPFDKFLNKKEAGILCPASLDHYLTFSVATSSPNHFSEISWNLPFS